ncbi:hypothetical protein Taro_051297 [Colocasia esculenta]|uniref:Uncharacterized protein n=1 Tax=Colocasia esculenta TaxID=4460 RepID=A0A843XGP7_COLES|nr:hypothetical protein [Colocasia esculenta]
MEQFKRMAPPSFKGESQPLLAESRMREIEKIFPGVPRRTRPAWPPICFRREPMYGGPLYSAPSLRTVLLRWHEMSS